jgi:NADH-quinone oxidoreductase subunit I
MTAAERKPDEKHLYREEKYASIYEINMLRCIFCGLCEDACPKTRSVDYLKTLVASVMREKIFLYMDRLVMPLDIMQNATKSQLMSTILIIFCVRSCHYSYCIF